MRVTECSSPQPRTSPPYRRSCAVELRDDQPVRRLVQVRTCKRLQRIEVRIRGVTSAESEYGVLQGVRESSVALTARLPLSAHSPTSPGDLHRSGQSLGVRQSTCCSIYILRDRLPIVDTCELAFNKQARKVTQFIWRQLPDTIHTKEDGPLLQGLIVRACPL